MLFKKKNKEVISQPIKEKAATGIAKFLLSVQTKFSDFMNTALNRLSIRRVKILLVVFCLFGGGYSFYLIAGAILNSNHQQPEMNVEKINVPKYYNKNGVEEIHAYQYIDEATYQRIGEYEAFMDSLQKTESGRKVYDSILLVRPGLTDSIRMLKEIYKSQIK